MSLLLKMHPRKLETNLFYEVSFSFFQYISINLSYDPVWNTVVTSWLVLLGVVRQTTYANEYAGLLVLQLLLLLNPLVHHRNVVRLSLFYKYYFDRCLPELSNLVPFPFSQGRSTRYSDRLHDFSVTIPRCCKYAYISSLFPCTARPRHFLPIECFPLTYSLNGCKSTIKRHLLTISSF